MIIEGTDLDDPLALAGVLHPDVVMSRVRVSGTFEIEGPTRKVPGYFIEDFFLVLLASMSLPT